MNAAIWSQPSFEQGWVELELRGTTIDGVDDILLKYKPVRGFIIYCSRDLRSSDSIFLTGLSGGAERGSWSLVAGSFVEDRVILCEMNFRSIGADETWEGIQEDSEFWSSDDIDDRGVCSRPEAIELNTFIKSASLSLTAF